MPFRQPFSYADSMGKLWWVIKSEPISAHVVSIRPFVLQLALVNNKENIQGSRYWSFVMRIDQWLVDFPQKDQCITEIFHVVTSPRSNENSHSSMTNLRETLCNVTNDINKLLAIECIIIDIMSVSNTTGILFHDIKWLIHWSLFVLNSVVPK